MTHSIAVVDGEGVGSLKNAKRPPNWSRDHCTHPHYVKRPRYERCLLSRRIHEYPQKQVDHDVLYASIHKTTESVPHIIRLDTYLNVIVGGDGDLTTVIRDCVSVPSKNGTYISTAKPKPVGLERSQ